MKQWSLTVIDFGYDVRSANSIIIDTTMLPETHSDSNSIVPVVDIVPRSGVFGKPLVGEQVVFSVTLLSDRDALIGVRYSGNGMDYSDVECEKIEPRTFNCTLKELGRVLHLQESQIEVVIGNFYTKSFTFTDWPRIEQVFPFNSEFSLVKGANFWRETKCFKDGLLTTSMYMNATAVLCEGQATDTWQVSNNDGFELSDAFQILPSTLIVERSWPKYAPIGGDQNNKDRLLYLYFKDVGSFSEIDLRCHYRGS